MGIGSFHPNGKPYQVKGAGSFFLMNNFIFKNPYEVIELLKEDFGIEYKTIREHFFMQKIKQKVHESKTRPNILSPLLKTVPTKGPPKTR